MKKIFFIPLFLFGLAFAQELNYSGSLTALAGAGLAEDNAGNFLAGQLAFDNTLKAYIGDSMFCLNAAIVADGTQSQSTNGISNFASDDGIFSIKLKEAYFDYNGGFWSVRAGRQIAAWGKADGIQVADILCPQDESNLIASTYKESRLGIDALRVSFMGNFFQSDLYWIPIFTPSTLPLAEKSVLRKVVFPDRYENFALNCPRKWNDFDLPGLKLENSEFAARVGFYFSKFDLSFYGFYGWDDLPFFSYNAVSKNEVVVTGTYKRMGMLGADAAIPMGDFVFRLETAFFPQRNIQTSAEWQAERQMEGLAFDGSKHCNQLVALAGFDWTPSGGWTITAQYIADAAFASKSKINKFDGSGQLVASWEEDPLDRKVYVHRASLTVEKTLLNESLTLSALAFLDLNDFSSATELSAEYALTDAIKLGLVGNLFFKGIDGRDGLYGAYSGLTCLTLKGVVSF